jgi:hypothetical protein
MDNVVLLTRCRKSSLKSLGTYAKEHFPNASFGVYPIESDSKVAIIIVANKYSPNNFWYETPQPAIDSS